MSTLYFKLYLEEILSFTRTLVIKCGSVADTINTQLESMGYQVDHDDPTSWKYYMNLAGEYHPTDTKMTVKSMDTLQTIEFNKSNLRIHRATAREYQPGTRYYRDLAATYPDQVPLINGIIAGVDKQQAIDASDGAILYYDTSLVESNEEGLVHDLQLWIYSFFNSWYNRQYILTDDLYLPAFLGILYQQIPQRVQLIRLKKAKSPEAHSFHVREYLASHDRLDTYIPYLTKEQQLFLYRNIRYIQRNVGKQEIFDRLLGELMTKRGLPLTWYQLRQRLEEPVPNPQIEMVKQPVNFDQVQSGIDTVGVHTILERQQGMARDNSTVQRETEVWIEEEFGSSAHSRLPTKVLESEVIDRTNASVRSLPDILVNHWVYLASNGRYRGFVNIPHPTTGDYITMSVRDSFLVALWAFAKARGETLDTIPRVIAYDVLRTSLPTYFELTQVVDPNYVKDGLIQAVMDRITPLGEYINTDSFNEACSNLHQEYLRLWQLYSFQEHYITRGLMEQVVKSHFQHIKCELVDTVMTYDQWFSDSGYSFDDLSTGDLEQLYIDCVNISTGTNLSNKVTLAEVQNAMLRLMRSLSSYSVQYLKNLHQGDFLFVGPPDIRVGDIVKDTHSYFRVSGSRITALEAATTHSHHYPLHNDDVFVPDTLRLSTDTKICVDVHVPIRLVPSTLMRVPYSVGNIGVLGYEFTIDNPTPGDDDLQQYNP